MSPVTAPIKQVTKNGLLLTLLWERNLNLIRLLKLFNRCAVRYLQTLSLPKLRKAIYIQKLFHRVGSHPKRWSQILGCPQWRSLVQSRQKCGTLQMLWRGLLKRRFSLRIFGDPGTSRNRTNKGVIRNGKANSAQRCRYMNLLP